MVGDGGGLHRFGDDRVEVARTLLSALSALSVARRAERPRAKLLGEISALRHQLAVYQRRQVRPKLRRSDRVLWIWLMRHLQSWREVLVVVQPDMVRRRGPRPGSTWRQLVEGPAHEFFSLDSTTHTRDASGWNKTPRTLLLDNDGIFGQLGTLQRVGKRSVRCALDLWLAKAMGATGVPTPYGALNANVHVERFVGPLRRECLDHFIFLSEGHLRRTVTELVDYDNKSRPHQGLVGLPDGEAIELRALNDDEVVVSPVLGGLHHDYRRAAKSPPVRSPTARPSNQRVKCASGTRSPSSSRAPPADSRPMPLELVHLAR